MSVVHPSCFDVAMLESFSPSCSSCSSYSSADSGLQSAGGLASSDSQSDISPFAEEELVSEWCTLKFETLLNPIRTTPNLLPLHFQERGTSHESGRDLTSSRRCTDIGQLDSLSSEFLARPFPPVSIEPLTGKSTQACSLSTAYRALTTIDDGLANRHPPSQKIPGSTRLRPTILSGTPSPIEHLPPPLILPQSCIATGEQLEHAPPSIVQAESLTNVWEFQESTGMIGLGISLPTYHPIQISGATSLLHMSVTPVSLAIESPFVPQGPSSPSMGHARKAEQSPSLIESLPCRMVDGNIATPLKHHVSKTRGYTNVGLSSDHACCTPREGRMRHVSDVSLRYSPPSSISPTCRASVDKPCLRSTFVQENVPPVRLRSLKLPKTRENSLLASPSVMYRNEGPREPRRQSSILPGFRSPLSEPLSHRAMENEPKLSISRNDQKGRLQPTILPESPSPILALPSPRLFHSFQCCSRAAVAS